MSPLKIISYFFSSISRKILLWKSEQQSKRISEKYGSLTRYHLNDGRAEIGDFTYGIPQIIEYGSHWKLRIGKFCCISNNVEIIFGGQHHFEFVSQYAFIPQVQKIFPEVEYHDRPIKDVVIGNDVWIGRNATILQGVTIGDGAVIGTNALITKDVPPYAIVGGCPAKVIKYRFSDDVINSLLSIKWWDWPVDMIKKYMPMIMSEKIDEFISKFDNHEKF